MRDVNSKLVLLLIFEVDSVSYNTITFLNIDNKSKGKMKFCAFIQTEEYALKVSAL